MYIKTAISILFPYKKYVTGKRTDVNKGFNLVIVLLSIPFNKCSRLRCIILTANDKSLFILIVLATNNGLLVTKLLLSKIPEK